MLPLAIEVADGHPGAVTMTQGAPQLRTVLPERASWPRWPRRSGCPSTRSAGRTPTGPATTAAGSRRASSRPACPTWSVPFRDRAVLAGGGRRSQCGRPSIVARRYGCDSVALVAPGNAGAIVGRRRPRPRAGRPGGRHPGGPGDGVCRRAHRGLPGVPRGRPGRGAAIWSSSRAWRSAAPRASRCRPPSTPRASPQRAPHGPDRAHLSGLAGAALTRGRCTRPRPRFGGPRVASQDAQEGHARPQRVEAPRRARLPRRRHRGRPRRRTPRRVRAAAATRAC